MMRQIAHLLRAFHKTSFIHQPSFVVETTSAAQLQQIRGIRLFDIFSKEKRKEQRLKLRDEMQRGYFDDFRDFRDKNGKIFFAPDRIIPAAQALPFPEITALTPSGAQLKFPATSNENKISFACIAFRAGAQDMIEAWAIPFSKAFQNNTDRVQLYEIGLIESPVMALWPFKSFIMSSGGKSQEKYSMPASYLYYFKNTKELRAALFMTNRLSGYVYVIDNKGRVRWRGSGHPEAKELDSLLDCCKTLLDED